MNRTFWHVLIVFAVASAIGAARYQTHSATNKQLEDRRNAYHDATNALAAVEHEYEETRSRTREVERMFEVTSRRATELKAEVSKAHPEIRDLTPPESLPSWIDGSPYIWIRKDRLSIFPINAFDDRGKPRSDFLQLLVTDTQQNQRLTSELPKILNDYRQLELGRAKYVDEPLPGISDGDIKTVRIEPAVREGAVLKAQFMGVLTEVLGEQRANLFHEVSETWIDQQFGQGADPKIISLVRHPNGQYNISVKQSGGWISCGIWKNAPRAQFGHYIPPHILPMFDELLPSNEQVNTE